MYGRSERVGASVFITVPGHTSCNCAARFDPSCSANAVGGESGTHRAPGCVWRMTAPTITQQVREMYTRFPYPPPGAMDGVPFSAFMDYIRHIFWPARSDLAGLRVLDAG